MRKRGLIGSYTGVGLRLPPKLVIDIKVQAAIQGISLREWMEDAVRNKLKESRPIEEILKRKGD